LLFTTFPGEKKTTPDQTIIFSLVVFGILLINEERQLQSFNRCALFKGFLMIQFQ
jgi:hypothetical protein